MILFLGSYCINMKSIEVPETYRDIINIFSDESTAYKVENKLNAFTNKKTNIFILYKLCGYCCYCSQYTSVFDYK